MVELQIETASDLAGRRVVVVGLARTGLAVAEFLLSQGSEVVATDILPAERLDEQIKTLATRGAVLELGGHQNETFLEADLIVVSPGVPPTIQPLQMALAKGVPVIGELEFASFYVTAPLIAVTGTNGKSTTTALIGEILQAAGRRVFVGGNIGNPLMNAVNSREEFDLAVVEVSSFQLEGVESFHPKVALHLNLTPDHLDRHVDFCAYAEAKARLFSRQTADDTAILNADDDQVAAIRTRARRLMFSRRHELGNGAFIKEGKIVLAQGGRPLGELPLEELSLTGSHNHENVMAALLAAWALGIETETALEATARFQGLPHRVEFIGRYGGVRYYNDSKATNVGAVIRSVEGFSEPVILIAGGRDKDSDFTLLRPAVRGKVRLMILLGEARKKMAQALKGTGDSCFVRDMAEAVALARKKAKPGEVVLLSPGCASFDMFTDYAHRGRVFTDLVRRGDA